MTMARRLGVIRVQDGHYRPLDDPLFVVGGNQNRDPGSIAGHIGAICSAPAEAVVNGKCSDEDQSPAHEQVADEKDQHDKAVDGAQQPKTGGIHARPETLVRGDGRHDIVVGFAKQCGHRHNLISARAQPLE